METFVTRNYQLLFGLLMVAIVGLAFYVGILEGKQSAGQSVTLSCSQDVLSKLTIPTKALAQSHAAAQAPSLTASASTTSDPSPQGAFAGSKNGTKYYTPGCAGLDRIKPENIIWFQSTEDATLQGYTQARC